MLPKQTHGVKAGWDVGKWDAYEDTMMRIVEILFFGLVYFVVFIVDTCMNMTCVLFLRKWIWALIASCYLWAVVERINKIYNNKKRHTVTLNAKRKSYSH